MLCVWGSLHSRIFKIISFLHPYIGQNIDAGTTFDLCVFNSCFPNDKTENNRDLSIPLAFYLVASMK